MAPAALLAAGAGAAAAAGLGELALSLPRRRRGGLAGLVARVGASVGVQAPRGLAARVAAAGLDRSVSDVVALQAGLALVAGLVVAPFVPAAPGRLGPLLLLAAPAAGLLAPELGLRRRTQARRAAMELELPDVLDLLRVAVGAGLAPRRALTEVGRRHPRLLARQLARAAQPARLGEPIDPAPHRPQARRPAARRPP